MSLLAEPCGRWLAVLPWIVLAAFMAFAALASVQVGHWPMYSRPDPKDVEVFGLRAGLFGEPVFYFGLLAAISAVAGLVLVVRAAAFVVRARKFGAIGEVVLPVSVWACGLWLLFVAIKVNENWLMD